MGRGAALERVRGRGPRGKLRRRPDRRFLFRLALRLGRSVRELLHTVGAGEIAEWAAYDRISPIGDERGDLHAAIVADVISRVNGNKTTLKQFMLFEVEDPPPAVPDEERMGAIKSLFVRASRGKSG